MRRAFTLVELMIVIVIIGVVYAFVVSKIETPKQNKKLSSFVELREYLQNFRSQSGDVVALVCRKECQSCDITKNGAKVKSIKPFFDATVKRFTYDYFEGIRDVDDGNCFALSVDGDGVSDQYIVAYKEKAYDFINYFTPAREYNSTEELMDAKANLIQVVSE